MKITAELLLQDMDECLSAMPETGESSVECCVGTIKRANGTRVQVQIRVTSDKDDFLPIQKKA